jgi:hypothetical protein
LKAQYKKANCHYFIGDATLDTAETIQSFEEPGHLFITRSPLDMRQKQ